MWLFKPSTSRRREVRKAIPRKRRTLRQVLYRSEVILGLLILTLFLTVAGLIVIEGRSEQSYRPDQLVDRTQIARMSFRSLDNLKTDEARKTAAELEPAIYNLNEPFIAGTATRLKTLPTVVASVEFEKLTEDIQNSFALSPEAHQALRAFQVDSQPTEEWVKLVDGLLTAVRDKVVLLDSERFQVEQQNRAQFIRLSPSGRRIADGEVHNVSDKESVQRALRDQLQRFPEPIRGSIATYFAKAREPTYRFDINITKRVKDEASRSEPRKYAQYEPNSVLVPAGEILTVDGYNLLEQEREAYLASLAPWARFMHQAGPLMLLALITGMIVVCLSALSPRVTADPMRGLAMAGLLLGALGLAWACRPLSPHGGAAAAVAPAVLTAMVLAVAYDQRLAVALGILEAALIGLAVDLSLGLYIVTIFASIAAVMQLSEVRKRGRLIRAGFVTALVVAAAVFVLGLFERQYPPVVPPGEIATWVGYDAITAFLATMAVGFFVLGSLPLIEHVFKVTTSMTLLELADMDHPLLRRLAQAAPGTFNHSLQVATLSEAGADAIGANGLLARVGAYYHDVGKVHKPMYFVENQAGGTNRHEKLSPAMSLLIIVGHVKDGVEMAREYGLPPVLHHFIEAHHGTTLVEYFYHAAKMSRDERQQPEEIEFRYPGPKPHTKEVAIVMICDAVESACRSMTEATATRIEQLVHKIAEKRLMDGQFDHCDITLNELRLVVEAVSKTLASIYHGRVAYPTDRKDKPADDRPEPKVLEERVAG